MLRWAAPTLAAVLGACAVDGNPSYPPFVFPHRLTITEGATTTFDVGLVGDPVAVDVVIIQGRDDCSSAGKLVFDPCRFSLSADHYPVAITMTVRGDADSTNDMVDATLYPDGSLASPDHQLEVYVIDTDAPNIIASNWNVTLPFGDAASFSVWLTQPPAAPITVAMEPQANRFDGEVPLVVTPSTLSFDATNFGVAQPVSVTGGITEAQEIYLTTSTGMRWGSVEVSPPIRTVY